MLRNPILLCACLLIGCGSDDKTTDDSAAGPTQTTTGTSTTTTTTDNSNWPASPADYVFGPSSYFHAFQIPVMETEPCCRDWGAISKDNILAGTNDQDNALAELRNLTAAMNLDLQATVDSTIESGGFVALLDHYNFPDGDGDYDLAFFRGNFENGSSWETAQLGVGEFLIEERNFQSGTGRPRAVFDAANVTGGQLHATGGLIEIAMPIIDDTLLILPLQDVTLEGTLSDSGEITNGELSGYVTVTDFYNGYNAAVADLCGCLNLQGDLFRDNGTETWDATCVANPETLCTAPEELVCIPMAGDDLWGGGELCTIIPVLMTSTPDLDLDGDTSTFEAMSVGFHYGAATANITGLAP